MDSEIAKQILDLQEIALSDETYQELYEEYKDRSEGFVKLLNTLSEEQRSILIDFLGVSISMHLRLLELACRRGDGADA